MKILRNMEEKSPAKYMEEYLYKKEGDKKWVEYWAVVCGKYIIFYKYRPKVEECKDAFQGCIELSADSKCISSKRKNYSFPFYIVTKKARYLFKTQSTLSRHKWFHAIELASQSVSPENPIAGLSTLDTHNTCVNDVAPVTSQIEEFSDDDESMHEEENASAAMTSSILVVPCSSRNQTSRFLERTPMDCCKPHCNESDVELTDLEEKSNLEKRLHHIYCGDDKAGIEKSSTARQQKHKPLSYIYQKPTPSQYNPSHSIHLKPSLKVSRLIKSAETLRDMPGDITYVYDTSQTSLLNQPPDSGSYLRNLDAPLQNRTLRKSRFSRHLVSSAPDVKMFFDGLQT